MKSIDLFTKLLKNDVKTLSALLITIPLPFLFVHS